jgi:hypothetical protein
VAIEAVEGTEMVHRYVEDQDFVVELREVIALAVVHADQDQD